MRRNSRATGNGAKWGAIPMSFYAINKLPCLRYGTEAILERGHRRLSRDTDAANGQAGRSALITQT